jgi:pyruvate-formate lyase-activating enzyme
MNVLLLHLPNARPSFFSAFTTEEPLAHLFFAPVLAERHRLRFVDLRLSANLGRPLAGFRPDVALVGVRPQNLPALDPCLAELRRLFPKVRVLLFAEAEYGNTHVGERPLDFAHPDVEAICQPYLINEMKRIVPAVVDAWARGDELDDIAGLWVQREPGQWTETEPVRQVDGPIGLPDRRLLGRYRGRYQFAGIGRMAYVPFTYGCKFKCRFCPMSKHDGTLTARDVSEVVAELEEITEPNVFLVDFEPFLYPDAMAALADAVERAGIKKRWYMLTRSDTALKEEALIRRWKDLGLKWLYLGLDGGSSERLKEIRKGTTTDENERALQRMQALGLGVSCGFVVRPDFTHEDFAELRGYVRGRLRPNTVAFSVETPLVGTALFDENEDRLTTRDWSLYDLYHAVLPTALPLGEFYRELVKLNFEHGVRALPWMFKHFPPRDLARSFLNGPKAMRCIGAAARDHG